MYLTISQVAKECGLSAHTLRYYDKEGLLPFVDRSPSGMRQFKESDFEWLMIINCLKDTGMQIKDIKVFIDWCLEGDKTIEQRYRMFVEQKKKLEEQLKILSKHMEKIDYKIWYYRTALDAGTLDVHKKVENLEKKQQPPRRKSA